MSQRRSVLGCLLYQPNREVRIQKQQWEARTPWPHLLILNTRHIRKWIVTSEKATEKVESSVKIQVQQEVGCAVRAWRYGRACWLDRCTSRGCTWRTADRGSRGHFEDDGDDNKSFFYVSSNVNLFLWFFFFFKTFFTDNKRFWGVLVRSWVIPIWWFLFSLRKQKWGDLSGMKGKIGDGEKGERVCCDHVAGEPGI